MATFGSSSPRAVQVATVEQVGNLTRTKLDVVTIKRIISENRIGDVPVVVIAIAGRSRTGKSYLLNTMISYLEHITQSPSDRFQPSPSDISGSTWAGCIEATKGIWLWEKAYVIPRKDNSKVAILFVDTQGISNHTQSAPSVVDSQIIYLALSMATIYIHNASKNFQMQEKEAYQICKSFSDVFGEDSNNENSPFNSFILLIRDWVEDKNYGCRQDIFWEEVDKANGDKEAYKIMTGLDKLFEHKGAWVFPPAAECLQARKGDHPLAEAEESFQNCVVDFITELLSPDGEYNKQMDDSVTGNLFVEMIEGLSDRLKNLPNLSSPVEQLKDCFLGQVFRSTKRKFENEVKTIEDIGDSQLITEWFEKAGGSAKDFFINQVLKYQPDDSMFSRYFYKLSKWIEGVKRSRLSGAKSETTLKKAEVTEDVTTHTDQKENDRRTQITEAMATRCRLNPQAVQIAAIEPSGDSSLTKLYADKIHMVIKSNGLEDIPVVVIAIAGKSRRGKSYLLSVIIAYLEHLSKSPSEPFQPSPSDISAMKWTVGDSAVTKGIWLWEKSFTITRKDNSKVAFLLLDTQGICDDTHSANPTVDSQIIYMALSMATIYIHNVSKDFQMPEKKVYQICKSYSEVCGESNQGDDERPLFNSFTLLVRDWTIDKNYGARPDIFRNEIKKAEGNEEASKIMHGIDKLFENKTVWVFPVPSEALQESHGNLSLEEAGEKFRDCVLLFLKALFSPDGEYNKQMDGAVTGKMLVEMLDGLSDRLANFPHLASDVDHLKDFYIRKAYHSAKQIFEDSLKSISTMHDLQDLNDRLGLAEDFALESFIIQAQKYKPDEKILSCYLDQLRKAIKNEKDIFVGQKELEAEKGCRENIEKENQTLKRDLVKYAAAGAGAVAGVAVIGAAVAAGPAVLEVGAGLVATAAKNPVVQQAAVAIGKAVIENISKGK